MTDYKQILQYFIEYEKLTGYIENSLDKQEGQNLDYRKLDDIEFLKVLTLEKKRNGIVNKVKQYPDIKEHISQNKYTEQEILKEIYNVMVEDIQVESFLEFLNFRYEDNKLATRTFIENILSDPLTICYPLLRKKTTKEESTKPLITFTCHLEKNILLVDDFYINRDSLEIIVAYFTKCSIIEVGDLEKKNILELISANEYKNQQDLKEIINIFNRELEKRFSKNIEDFKSYQDWQLLAQMFITFDSLNEIRKPIFQSEIKRILDMTNQLKIEPHLLLRYLTGKGNSRKYDKQDSGKKIHLGSYTDQYPINEKQWHIIEASEKESFLAVNGPPGTGKSTLLKELIANQTVKKANQLISIWEKPWIELNERGNAVYQIPLQPESATYSMVVASTNNNAVDNIGIELLKEVRYFTSFTNQLNTKESNEVNGFFCARLGNTNNKNEFIRNFLNIFQQELTVNQTNFLDQNIKKNFIKVQAELEEVYSNINEFLKNTSKVKEYFEVHLANLEISINSQDTLINSQKKYEDELLSINQNLRELISTICHYQLKKEALHKQTIMCLNQLENNEQKVKEGYIILEQYKKWERGKWYGWLIPVRRTFFKKYVSESYIKDHLIYNIQLEIEKSKNDYHSFDTELKKIESIIIEYEKEENFNKNKSKSVYNHLAILKNGLHLLENSLAYQHILENKYNLKADMSYDLFDFSMQSLIYKKRHELFQCSLRLIEYYICLHSKEVLHNLNIINDKEKWFSKFYSEAHKRDILNSEKIKGVWDTLFLCFPVVTSTLHSFSEDNFHMLPELIDTLFIDEAGQIMPHYLCGPLFRSKRAIIVGDIEQLQPIRLLKTNVIENSDFIVENDKATLCVQSNSAQHYADRNSYFYEEDHKQQKKGMILIEHRRCEENIMIFSNTHVYGSILKIVNVNNHNKLFGNNMLAFDVRGLKSRTAHFNQSEIVLCKRLVEQYVDYYGESIKKDIGIITPFSKQKEKLQAVIKGVDIGTVYAFQGQERKIIIFSTVIDNDDIKNTKNRYGQNGLTSVIGNEPNLLNVALSRAKEQFVLIGNMEVISNLKQNYLKNVYDIIKEKGICFSPFDEKNNSNYVDSEMQAQAILLYTDPNKNLHNHIDSPFLNYINQYVINHLLLTPKAHYELMLESLKSASSSIVIISPWIMDYVVNDNFIRLVEEAVARNVDIKIGFGYQGGKEITLGNIKEIIQKDYNQSFLKGEHKIEKIEQSIFNLKQVITNSLNYIPPIHTKLLLVDNKYLFISSHNWLSKIGKNKRDEIGCMITEVETIGYLKERYINVKFKISE